MTDRPVNLISSYADAVRAPSPISTPPIAPTPSLMSLNVPCPSGSFASHQAQPHVTSIYLTWTGPIQFQIV